MPARDHQTLLEVADRFPLEPVHGEPEEQRLRNPVGWRLET